MLFNTTFCLHNFYCRHASSKRNSKCTIHFSVQIICAQEADCRWERSKVELLSPPVFFLIAQYRNYSAIRLIWIKTWHISLTKQHTLSQYMIIAHYVGSKVSSWLPDTEPAHFFGFFHPCWRRSDSAEQYAACPGPDPWYLAGEEKRWCARWIPGSGLVIVTSATGKHEGVPCLLHSDSCWTYTSGPCDPKRRSG